MDNSVIIPTRNEIDALKSVFVIFSFFQARVLTPRCLPRETKRSQLGNNSEGIEVCHKNQIIQSTRTAPSPSEQGGTMTGLNPSRS